MEQLVPSVSSTVAGPLGIVHLPRLWLKAILAETDSLYEGWIPDYKGLNKLVVDALGIDPEAFFAFLATLPSYPETERWIAAHAKPDAASIAASNSAILEFQRAEDLAAPARERLGIADTTERHSAMLNNYDDWDTMHRWLVEHQAEELAPIIPTVSSSSAGLLGAKHLPRLWIKALLKRVGALPDDYNTGCGFDAFAASTLGLDLDAAIAFIHAELPSYPAFERYVRDHIDVDPQKQSAYNAAIVGRQKPAEKAAAERAEIGVPELAFRDSIMCNDMLDWKALHDGVLARRALRV